MNSLKVINHGMQNRGIWRKPHACFLENNIHLVVCQTNEFTSSQISLQLSLWHFFASLWCLHHPKMVTDIQTHMRECSICDSISQIMHSYSDNYIKNSNLSLLLSSKKWKIITYQNSVDVKNQMLTVSSPDLSEWALIISNR